MRQSGVAKAIFRFDREALVPCKTIAGAIPHRARWRDI
jgi:hypothetical protein